MKTLILCYENINGCNGSVRQILELSKNLKELGDDVLLCAPSIAVGEDLPVRTAYIPVINIPFIRYPSYLIFSFIFLPLIVRRFQPKRALYFMIHFNLSALLLFLLARIPFLLYINGIIMEERKEISLIERLLRPFMHIIYAATLRRAQAVLTVTEGIRKHLLTRYAVKPDSVKIIPCGVDTRVFHPMDKRAARQRCRYPATALIIGYHGSLFPWHGIDYLFRALPEIIKELPDTRCVIVGMGNQYAFLRDISQQWSLEKYVIFAGAIPFNDIPTHVNCFDIGISFFKPVRSDPGNPIKTYEYLACGVPVVTSNVSGYGDFVEAVHAGRQGDPADSSALARIIIEMLKNPEMREHMGRSGRKEAEEHHTWFYRASAISTILDSIGTV